MLKKLLPAFGAIFGPLGAGFSLWVASQNYLKLLGKYSAAVHYAGIVFMSLSPLMLVIVTTTHVRRWIKGKKIETDRLTNENKTLKDRLNWRDHEGASSAVTRCKEVWEKKLESTSSSNYQDDPVYLQLFLDQQLSNIVAQPIMQRLSHIKQL